MSDYFTYVPRPNSRTRRRELRSLVRRHLLGGKNGVPSARRTLVAAEAMAELVFLASDGKLTVKLEDQSGNRVHFRDAAGSASTDPEA